MEKTYCDYLQRIKDLHPGWSIRIYNREEGRGILAGELAEWLDLYDGYELDVQRVDLLRLALVYLQGGFYMDLDMYCLRNLDPLCDDELVLGEERTYTEEECREMDTSYALRIANYMFGSRPGHPFLLDVIREAEERGGRKAISCEEDVLRTSGPGLITDVYHRMHQSYPGIRVLVNKDRMCAKRCERISCHFGDFAAHMHHGKWRWESKGEVKKSSFDQKSIS